ncbi:MAG: TIGR03617 family F420-dependent LLM class oxidoreductase [Salinirussus sp.]
MADVKLDAWMRELDGDYPDLLDDIRSEGLDGLYFAEGKSNPFNALSIAADRTEDLTLGTRIALAFPRSPMLAAYAAWDVQRYSDGRFVLGLGTQVKAHNERRFSVDWKSPGPRLREVIDAIRHIWRVWQRDDPELSFEGEFYSFSLMTDNFDPGPIDNPDIPIFISALNPYNTKLAGEICDGIHLHPFNSPEYLSDVMYPWLEEGAERGGRSVAQDVTVSASPFIITGADDEAIEEKREAVRKRIAFYGSTPSYRDILEYHGWGDRGDRLHELSREGKWAEMADYVPDAMLEDYAVEAHHDHIVDAVIDAYGDLADRIVLSTYGYPFGKTLTP